MSEVKTITVYHPNVADDLNNSQLTEAQLRSAGGVHLMARLSQISEVSFHLALDGFFTLDDCALTGPYPTLLAAVDGAITLRDAQETT
jgi:hypothetical protein